MTTGAERLPTAGSLTPATVTGGLWITLSEIATKVLGGIKTVILARLLFPEDFGLMGLALVTVGTINMVSGVGIYTALIQKKQLENQDLNVAFWILLVRGLSLYLLLVPLSGVLAQFFDEPRLERIFQFIFLTFLFRGLQSIGLVRLSRALNFRRLMWLYQIANAVGLAVAIVLGWMLQNVWALVAAHLTQLVTLVVVSYVVEPFWPTLRIEWQRVKGLLNFGKYVLVASLATFFIIRGNEFVVAKLVGVELYGYYVLALSLIRLGFDSVGELITSLIFPAFSKIQEESERMAAAFSKVFRTAVLITTPLSVGLAIFGKDLVYLVLGSKWMPIVDPVIWLCFFGLFNVLTLTLQTVHYSLGIPQLQAKLRFLQLILYLVGALPMTASFGIAGAAAWLCVVQVVAFLLHLYASRPYVIGVVESCTAVLVSYWPLYIVQLVLAYLHLGPPATGLKFFTLALGYCVCVALFVTWKEKKLLLDLLRNLTGGRGWNREL
ncbi:lipopolysaccharide biosynthesis protein [Acidobacteria bacterium AH-259-D05]|nr:lipopolysaccharide biosynthesis protein [Acidobacteria bacterium AH-259-D05]